MKEVKRFQCEQCLKIYETEEKANKCEESHTIPDSVELPPKYNPKFEEMYGCPESVIVTMKNGMKYRYRYSRPFEEEDNNA